LLTGGLSLALSLAQFRRERLDEGTLEDEWSDARERLIEEPQRELEEG